MPPEDYRLPCQRVSLTSVASPAHRVLLIEDDPDIREALFDVLSAEGYLVAQAADGLEGLERARERRPHVILLDLMMPRMDGWAFREAQQADAALADIPVVVVSAVMAERVHALRAAAHLHKPFAMDELLGVVGRCVSRASA